MRNSTRFGLILLGLTLLVITLIDVTRDRQVDWTRTYNQYDKIPYGLFVTRSELPTILDDRPISDFTNTSYPFIKTFLKGKEASSVVYVVDRFTEGKEVVDELLNYVGRGGEVFISSNVIPYRLLDTLGIKQDYYYEQDPSVLLDFEDRPFSLSNGKKAFYKDLEYPGLFYDLDSSAVRIIGSFEAGKNKQKYPNFIEAKYHKGRFIFHLEPLMFTNYYMLQQDNYQYGATALKLLSRKEVYWYDAWNNNEKEARTPLRFLLLNDGLRQGWYILLFALILLLLFKSKREQAAVKVVLPEPNLSKEFAKTIASMYFENGTPGNLGQKKIEYFLYDLRTQFQLDIQQLEEPDFVQQVAMKSGVAVDTCSNLIRVLIANRNNKSMTDKGLLALNELIEDFKHKANML